MSDYESGRGRGGFGTFLLGVMAGVALGVLFASETGDTVRGKVSRRLRGLGERALDKAEELGEMVAEAAGDLEERPARRTSSRRNRTTEEEEPSE